MHAKLLICDQDPSGVAQTFQSNGLPRDEEMTHLRRELARDAFPSDDVPMYYVSLPVDTMAGPFGQRVRGFRRRLGYSSRFSLACAPGRGLKDPRHIGRLRYEGQQLGETGLSKFLYRSISMVTCEPPFPRTKVGMCRAYF
jgi:hypothetical protein